MEIAIKLVMSAVAAGIALVMLNFVWFIWRW